MGRGFVTQDDDMRYCEIQMPKRIIESHAFGSGPKKKSRHAAMFESGAKMRYPAAATRLLSTGPMGRARPSHRTPGSGQDCLQGEAGLVARQGEA